MSAEYTVEEEALRDIARELEELNGHIRAYLETMALTLMADCGGDPQSMKASKDARDAAAIKLLRHVQGQG